jgi:hypothetical protein
MRFELERKFDSSVCGEVIVFSGEVSEYDLVRLKLEGVDAMLINEPCVTAADFLLVLEMLFRRAAEQGVS